MECKKCKSKWESQLGASKSMTNCPFCGASLTDKEPMIKEGPFDTSKEALIYIAKKHGVETLLGNLKDIFPDYAPFVSKQIRGLALAVFQHGSAKILQDNISSKQAEKEIAFKKAVEKLTEAFITEQAATTIILEFTEALGWNITPPAADVHAPKPKKQQEKKKVDQPQGKGDITQPVLTVISQPPVKSNQVKQPESQSSISQQEGYVTLPDGEKMIFVKVPAGEFLMGASEDDPEANDDEKPQHRVYLDEYWIGKYPVTNAQYKLYDPGHSFEQGKENHPVATVFWAEALFFCLWMTKVTVRYITLPTEAQWEKAARGIDGRRYPWGNQPPTKRLANFGNVIKGTTPVDQYPGGASPYGALDMAGNVWEWCIDWYDENYYKHSPQSNPKGPGSGKDKVHRGASCDYRQWYLRASARIRCSPTLKLNFRGFRCCIDQRNWDLDVTMENYLKQQSVTRKA